MTPEQARMLGELYEDLQRRKRNQLSAPLDDISRLIIGLESQGAGSKTLTQTYTDSHGDTLTGPKAYAGTRVIRIDGTPFEFPFI